MTAVITCFADIKPEDIDWLWPGFIAFGKLSIIGGDPGLGKSLISLDLAARVSQGYLLPIDKSVCPNGDALILTNEDGPGDTIRPRLDGMKANVNRIHHLSMINTKSNNSNNISPRMFSLKSDIIELEKYLHSYPDTKLIIIDPIQAYCDGIDTHNNAEVRRLLLPLSEFAQKYKVAILAITHLSKGEQRSILNRLTGSIAFGAVARVVLLVVKDPHDESRRLVIQAKNNLEKDNLGLSYRIEPKDKIPTIKWEEQYLTIATNEIFSTHNGIKKSEIAEAATWLTEVLSSGKIESNLIISMGNAEGFSSSTLRRTKKQIGVIAVRDAFGEEGKWYWELPKMIKNPLGAHL